MHVIDPLMHDPSDAFVHLLPFTRIVHGFLDDSECAQLRARIEALAPALAPLSTAGGAVIRTDIRNNERVLFDDESLASALFARALPHLPAQLRGRTLRTAAFDARDPAAPTWDCIGLNERWRGYRYRAGQRFAPHYDGCFRRCAGEESAITFLVYLDDSCTGGETNLLEHGVVVRPTKGTLLMFDHLMLHEGALVTAGEKHVLRSDVMYRRCA